MAFEGNHPANVKARVVASAWLDIHTSETQVS